MNVEKSTRMVLVYPVQGVCVLLGKKQVRIGEGLLCGFGGRVDPQDHATEETDEYKNAAVRELDEECGLRAQVDDLRYAGDLSIVNPKYPQLGTLKIRIFTLDKWLGNPHPSEEMTPSWHKVGDLPWDRIREVDRYWLPAVLNQRFVTAKIVYDEEEKLIECILKITRMLAGSS